MLPIPKIDGGFWYVLSLGALFMPIVWYRAFAITHGFARKLALVVFLLPFGIAAVSFLLGLGLLTFQVILWAKAGEWMPFTVRDLAMVLDFPTGLTGWERIDREITALMDRGAEAILMAGLPMLAFGAWLPLMALLFHLSSLADRVFSGRRRADAEHRDKS